MYPQTANISLQGLDRCELTVGAISGHLKILPLAPFHKLWIYVVDEKHSGKAYQLTLASAGSKHA